MFFFLNFIYFFIQQVLISYPFYTHQCTLVNPNLPIYPSPPTPKKHFRMRLVPNYSIDFPSRDLPFGPFIWLPGQRDSWEPTCFQVNCFTPDVSVQVQLWKFRLLYLQVFSLHLTFHLVHGGLLS